MSNEKQGESAGGFEGHRVRRGSRPPWVILSCLVVGLICALSGCGGGGAGPAPSSQITFTSDRSVILPRSGSTFQFVAKAGAGGNITWTSSDPQAVTVNSSGLATAVTQTGSATITATAPGIAPITASVIVAAPGPHTVLIDSADVVAIQGTQVTLALKPATNSIAVGDIVVSGDKVGLLGKVQSVSTTAQKITLQTAPASLVQAFPDLSVHLLGAPVTMTLLVTNGRAALITPNGRTVAVSRASGFPCEDTHGASVSATLSGPSFSAPVQAHLEATLTSQGLSVQNFSLLANVKITAQIETGSVTFAANGQTDFTCKEELPGISLPGVPVGPIMIEGKLSPEADVTISANANATLTLSGPSVSDTFTAAAGISWTRAGGWQSSLTSNSTGPTVTPPGMHFTAQVQGKVSAAIRTDTGISATAADFDLVGANFAFDQLEGVLNFNMLSPLVYTSSGYTGPTWNADLNLSSGPELQITGGVTDLLNHLGVPTDLATWSLYNKSFTLAQSPTPQLTASAASVSQGGSETLTASQPTNYAGSKVQFYAFPASGAPIQLGSATVGSTGAAAFTWSPAASQDGTYQIGAFLFGDAFGTAGFPYPSNRVAVKAGGGNVGVGIH